MSPTKKGKYECKKYFRIYVLCTIISDTFFHLFHQIEMLILMVDRNVCICRQVFAVFARQKKGRQAMPNEWERREIQKFGHDFHSHQMCHSVEQ